MTRNENQLSQLLSRFKSQEELSISQIADLKQYLDCHHDLIDEVLDCRAINGMLQLLATDETDNEQFIDRCLEKMKPSQNSAGMAEVSESESLKPPCSETKTNSEIFDQITRSSKQPVGRRSTRKPIAKRPTSRILVVIVSLVVALLTIWSGVDWLGKESSIEKDENGLAIVTRPDSVGSDPTLTSPILSDKVAELEPTPAPNNPSATAGKNEFKKRVARSVPVEKAILDAETEIAESQASNGSMIQSELASPIEQNQQLVEGGDQLVPESTKGERTSEQEIATVTMGKTGRWENKRSPEDFGAGEYKLVEGSARLKFRNHVLLQVLAPAQFTLKHGNSIRLLNGSFFAEIPRAAKTFEIVTNQGVLQDPENVRLQLIVDADNGVETLVSRGSIAFVGADEEDSQRIIGLAKNGLFQLVVRPAISNPVVSPVLIARGKKDFVGQIGSGRDTISTNSPTIFANVMYQINEVPNDAPVEQSLKNKWPVFAQRFHEQSVNIDSPEFRNLIFNGLNQNSRDVSGTGSTNFQGSVTVNGVEKTFSSLAEYEQALQMLEGTVPPSLFSLPKLLNQANDEKPIKVNGQKLDFSSPEKFKDLKRQMSR